METVNMTRPQPKQQNQKLNHEVGLDMSWTKVATICLTILATAGGSLAFINEQWERQFDFLKSNQTSLEGRTDRRFDKIDSRFDKLDEKIDRVLAKISK